jgi:acyl carrier protein
MSGVTLSQFCAAVADVASRERASVTATTRLIDDLDLDSFALAEVIVALIVDFHMESALSDLEKRDWPSLTVGDLYQEYATGSSGVVKRTLKFE